MAIDLKGLPIAITGASSGIGAATAVACAEAGMPVVLAARRLDRCQDLAATIRARGGEAVATACDVTDKASCETLVATTISTFGSIYALYANAGYGVESAADTLPDDQLRAIFETNFFGTINAIRPALVPMKAAGRGHVLICSSCLGRMAVPYFSAYSATKAAQLHIGRAMRIELAPLGISVSTVHPIGTRTEFFGKVKAADGSDPALVNAKDSIFMQDASFVARRTVACLRRPRSEVWTGTMGMLTRLGMSVCTALPGIENPILARMVKARRKTD
ncbi:MAG: SDR family NAD(P)-dependent oxidoreductase [Phycisphaerales bacterium]